MSSNRTLLLYSLSNILTKKDPEIKNFFVDKSIMIGVKEDGIIFVFNDCLCEKKVYLCISLLLFINYILALHELVIASYSRTIWHIYSLFFMFCYYFPHLKAVKTNCKIWETRKKLIKLCSSACGNLCI